MGTEGSVSPASPLAPLHPCTLPPLHPSTLVPIAWRDEMLVKDLELAQKYRRVPAGATAAEAIALMAEYHIPIVLVEKGSEGDTYGVLTRRDIISKVIGEGRDPTRVTVSELASKPLMVLNNNEVDVIWVARFMAREHVSSMALFDGGVFKGFVTDADIMRALAAPLKAEFGHHGGHKK